MRALHRDDRRRVLALNCIAAVCRMVIQMFRDLGLTPGYGENGDIDKLLVRE